LRCRSRRFRTGVRGVVMSFTSRAFVTGNVTTARL
jgi:hypothetical protein